MHMSNINVYFSDYFNIDREIIDDYGAVDISLINDLPLFIDPFLLFNSKKQEYRNIHDEIIKYLLFLKQVADINEELGEGMKKAWFTFSEVKQTWLGFSISGNDGLGLGNDFAKSIFNGLKTVFTDFGKETITQGQHLEKICLISNNVGRDKISDFTTNFVKKYLLEYTENFARKYLKKNLCKKIVVPRVYFNWDTHTWASEEYYLPYFDSDFVLLTPKDMLTKDETFINRLDMLHNLEEIASSVTDEELRFKLEQYFRDILHKTNKEVSRSEKEAAAQSLIKYNPELIDYYIRFKENQKDQATSISQSNVYKVEKLYRNQVASLIELLYSKTNFYKISPNAYDEAKNRVMFLKHVIEDQDGYKLFYLDGQPVQREKDLQIIYRLVWYGSPLDVNSEVNNGRGPVDYKVSYGVKNSVLVEFKLAKNSKLKNNLAKQVEVYKKASETDRAIKVILYFNEKEYSKIHKILNNLGLNECEDIILIDARSDNKESASNVKIGDN